MSAKHLSKDSPYPPLLKDVMRFYTMRFCPYAQRVALVAAVKHIPIEYVYINLVNKPTWYLEKNPLGKTPCLEINNQIVTDSLICSQFLDDFYPNNKLTPEDPYKKAKCSMLLGSFGKFTEFMATFKQNYSEDTVNSCLEILKLFEQFLQDEETPFFGGNQIGLLDLMIWPWFERLQVLPKLGMKFDMPEEKFPCLSKWQVKMKDHQDIKKTAINISHYINFLKTIPSGNPVYDPDE